MDFSLSIGLDNYLHLRSTPYAENDASSFHSVMENIYSVDYSLILKRDHATRTNILSKLKDISTKIESDDRFFFFFAGHGANISGTPFLSCYDSDYKNVDTWLNILEVIKLINSVGSKKNIYFIDACESTISLGSRKEIASFSVDELQKNAEENSYTSIFTSTSHKGVADINPETKHGIWTNFLLKALAGKDEKALNDKLWLTNKTLQNYLSLSVKSYCKKNPKITVQNSFSWGKEEGEYIIKVFQKKELSVYKTLPSKAVEKIGFSTTITENVKRLPGFKKGSHSVPRFFSNTTSNFVKSIAEDELSDHMEHVSKALRKLFGLKSREFQLTIEDGFASFICPYFTYNYWVELNPDDLSEAIFTAELNPIDLEKIIEFSKDIDKCFPQWFDNLIYSLSKTIDVEDLIDTIELAESDVLEYFEIDYNSEKTYVSIFSKDLNREIIISKRSVEIRFQVKETIPDMIEGLKEISNQLMLVSNSYKLLG